MIAQLPLNIQLRDHATFSSFYPGDNLEAFNAITHILDPKTEPFLYVWGCDEVGKSHLLQAACNQAMELGLASAYFSLKDLVLQSPEVWQGIESLSLICVDDLEYIAGNPVWEEALFHLFNRILLQQNRLFVSANSAPKDLAIALPDLKSRLASGVTYQLHRLTDDQKIKVLQLRAKQRGLKITLLVGRFLLNHCSRSMTELFGILEVLDRASLAEQRRLTIPFVKQILSI